MKTYPKPPFDTPEQQMPGTTPRMNPVPDHGEKTYVGSGKLKNRIALITGGDSGIGRAVALAYAREGADLMVAYLSETDDAETTKALVVGEGRRCELFEGDLADPHICRDLVARTVDAFGRIDILVNNAAHQTSFETLEEVPDEEWERTFAVNISAMFYITKAALPHMPRGSAIINTASINADKPNPQLLAYATTKGAIQNFTAGLAQLLGERGIRANSVAPGPIWTPLIPATMPADAVREFGGDTPLGRPGQPAELAGVYVLLASDDGSYISGAMMGVTGGRPIL
jgi:NAD(P)-dependent dehydrogenase (short-subunit alcohol dehydrogenase family)